MPVKEGQAKLWFSSKEEADAYDDKMISSIELKSSDFDDENFSPVFNRKTQEYFLEPSEKFKNDHAKLLRPLQALSFNQAVDRYILIPPNHTYYRNWTYEKFIGGFGLSYLLLRELPLRNFYARVFVMYVFAAKILDHLGNPFPFSGHGSIVGAADRWHHWDVRCYDNVMKALRYIRIPTVQNQVPEATKWYGRQPGHLLRADTYWAPNFISQRFAHHKTAHWDGTQNMPIFRLADPKHKDSFMIQFR